MPDNNIIDLAYTTTFDPCRGFKKDGQEHNIKDEMKACIDILKKDTNRLDAHFVKATAPFRKSIIDQLPKELRSSQTMEDKAKNDQKLNTYIIQCRKDVNFLIKLYQEDSKNEKIQRTLGTLGHLYSQASAKCPRTFRTQLLNECFHPIGHHIVLQKNTLQSHDCSYRAEYNSYDSLESITYHVKHTSSEKPQYSFDLQHQYHFTLNKDGLCTQQQTIQLKHLPDEIFAHLKEKIPEVMQGEFIGAKSNEFTLTTSKSTQSTKTNEFTLTTSKSTQSTKWQKATFLMMGLTMLQVLAALLYFLIDHTVLSSAYLWFQHYLPALAILATALITFMFAAFCHQQASKLKTQGKQTSSPIDNHADQNPSPDAQYQNATLTFQESQYKPPEDLTEKKLLYAFVEEQTKKDIVERCLPSICQAVPILEALIKRDLPELKQETYDEELNDNYTVKQGIQVKKVMGYLRALKSNTSQYARGLLYMVFELCQQSSWLNVASRYQMLFNWHTAPEDNDEKQYSQQALRSIPEAKFQPKETENSTQFNLTIGREHNDKDDVLMSVLTGEKLIIGGSSQYHLQITVPKKKGAMPLVSSRFQLQGCHPAFVKMKTSEKILKDFENFYGQRPKVTVS